MNESIFTKIMGLGGEDVTTELLNYLLTKEEYKHLKITILNIFFGINIDDIESYEIGTQKAYEKGRPDLIIENDNEIIIIENKFYADFSGGDQILRYIEILEKENINKTKTLILLTVKNRKDYLIKKIYEQIGTSDIEVYFYEKNIKFKVLFWNNLLEIIETNDILTKELKKNIYENYIIDSEIGDVEMELLNNSKIPELMEKIWNAISANRIFMERHNYKVARMSQSRMTYLYYIKFTWGKICIQYFHDFWSKYNTPFSIQLMDQWNDKSIDFNKLNELGFIKDENYQYVFPVIIDGKDLVDSFNTKVLEKVNKIKELYDV